MWRDELSHDEVTSTTCNSTPPFKHEALRVPYLRGHLRQPYVTPFLGIYSGVLFGT
jgi:hypothetical protein